MKASDIKVGHIYNINYEPTKGKEFGKIHLGVVLKKNHNKVTFVTIPLTSDAVGLGVNKIDLGILECLPANLKTNNSYAVFDQIRTLDASRFMTLKENGSVLECSLPKDLLQQIYAHIIKDLLHDVEEAEKQIILHNV